jgi:cytoskeletal protein RodZ
LFAPTITAPPPAVPQVQAPVNSPQFQPPAMTSTRKRRSPLMLGCLIIIGLIVVAAGAGGIYVWRRVSYSPPVRQAPEIPQRVAGTMTEFPVDNDPNAPAKPTSVQTESLGGATTKSDSASTAKLPPGVDRSKLSKGATTMTSSTYKPQPKSSTASSTSDSTKDNVYICVLTSMPNQPNFGDGLATSVVQATNGTKTGVKVQSPKGATYIGSKIRSPQANVYVLTKQGADVVILIYGTDSSTTVIDRLAQSVGNGAGLIDYPEVKESLWTLPAKTPSDLTLQEINTLTGAQIGSGGDLPSGMRPFIPDRLTSARYTDAGRQEWVALNLEYGSTFQAWRTWLLARSALGLSGAQTTTVRDVDALYLNQEGKRILVFQKGPYLVFLSGPGSAAVERLAALGNQIQV